MKNLYACAFCQESFSSAATLVGQFKSQHVPFEPFGAASEFSKDENDINVQNPHKNELISPVESEITADHKVKNIKFMNHVQETIPVEESKQ